MNPTPHRRRHADRAGRASLLVVAWLALAACSGGGDSGTADDATTAPTTAAPTTSAATATTDTGAPDSGLDELDDLDEDGEFDERCGTADLGGGLVVETLCTTSLVPTPADGVNPLPNSLLTLPSPPRWDDLAGVDAVVKVATRPGGGRVAIYMVGSDVLFDNGAAVLRTPDPASLAAIVASISARFPGAAISVRVAANTAPDTAGNQSLSEQQAATVVQQLVALGLPAAGITALGLGDSVPIAADADTDGSASTVSPQVNRRVEIVVG